MLIQSLLTVPKFLRAMGGQIVWHRQMTKQQDMPTEPTEISVYVCNRNLSRPNRRMEVNFVMTKWELRLGCFRRVYTDVDLASSSCSKQFSPAGLDS